MSQPRLVAVRTPRHPSAYALVLHGGAARKDAPAVSATQLSVLRMIPVARRLARAGRGRLAVFRVLNSHRGWDRHRSPADDARWALRRVAERYGDLPAGLVSHSLGGRAALLAGGAPGVESVVALNPWLYPDDDVDLSGRRVLVVHGTDDRIADPRTSAAVARALGRRTSVGYVTVPGGRHAMLRHGGLFERYAAEFTAAVLLGDPAGGAIGEVLDGA